MNIKRKIPYIVLFVFATSLLLLSASHISEDVAVWMNFRVCSRVRGFLANLTSKIQISLFEVLVLISPLLLFLTVRYVCRNEKQVRMRFFRVLSFLTLLPSLYILTLGIPYKAPLLFSEYNKIPNADDVFYTAKILCDEVNKNAREIEALPTLRQISSLLSTSYKAVSGKYEVRVESLPTPKPLITSRAMSYIGTLAFYSFPTGEVNINVDIPSYMIPFTVAHELAHCVGVASEGEASFLAYLVSSESENPYIRYSASLSVLELILSDVKRIDKDEYLKIYDELPARALSDIADYRKYSEKYYGSFTYRASEKINSMHLEVSDRMGKASYSALSRYVTNYIISA